MVYIYLIIQRLTSNLSLAVHAWYNWVEYELLHCWIQWTGKWVSQNYLNSHSTFPTTGKSWFKKSQFFFLKSRVVWFKKYLCTESVHQSAEKKSCLMKVNLQVEVFLKWRFHCTKIRSECLKQIFTVHLPSYPTFD